MSAVEIISAPWLWAHLIAIAIATFVLRASFIGLIEHLTIPDEIKEHMKLIPPAVLAALAAPPLLYQDGNFHLSLGNPFLVAGIVAIVVAWRTENLLATIVAGFVAYFVIAAIFGF